MNYTKKDLKDVRKRYRKNFKDLLASVATREHSNFVRIERLLYNEEIKIQKALGVFVSNPCPTHSPIYCWECSGYCRKVEGNTKHVECKKNDKGAYRCRLSLEVKENINFRQGNLVSLN